MTRAEHIEWAKARAIEFLDQTRPSPALASASLISDLMKHPETRSLAGEHIHTLTALAVAQDVDAMRGWIERLA